MEFRHIPHRPTAIKAITDAFEPGADPALKALAVKAIAGLFLDDLFRERGTVEAHAIGAALKAMDAAIAGKQTVQISPFVFAPTWGSGLPAGVIVNYDYTRFVAVEGMPKEPARVEAKPLATATLQGTDPLDACDRLSAMVGILNQAIASLEPVAYFEDVDMRDAARAVVAMLAPGAVQVELAHGIT